jgi:nitroreductase
MMDVIRGRRSVRHYDPDKPVSDEDVRRLLEAAMCAPSGNNARPWEIIVVRDKELRTRLSKLHQWARFCEQSPVVIAICANPARGLRWWLDDCAAATQNILLAAHSLGLGACWIGVHADETGDMSRENYVREVLGIPQGIRVCSLISVGYPADQPRPRPDRYDENLVHYDGW